MQTAKPIETNENEASVRPGFNEEFRALAHKLRKDCQPESALEEEVFRRYVWAIYQSSRGRQNEAIAEDRWLADPDSAPKFNQMERMIKLGIAQERRADKAMRELRELQKDRFAAYEVYAEHCVMGKEVNIPKSLPTAEIRKSDLGRTSPNYLAQFLLHQTKEVKDTAKRMFKDAKSKDNVALTSAEENPFANLSIEELLSIAKQTGLSK